ncbi:ABC transporter permease [Neobacillus notoginsengisoli]|uniref:ABC transporter permease n=1 Tax=Neobacillus notoginsengisoli TaxID=1578198 RepID=A0A417YTA0_9BACI|nr:ABC transporter permease [Neobacillus notoginsengisoli]RHW40298.1 ABC transporter permease [Neobacillus notoginsengisoli]
MEKFLTVLKFHLKEGLSGKGFIITAAVLFAAIFGYFGFTHYFGKEEKMTVYVSNQSSGYSFETKGVKAEFADIKEVDEAKTEGIKKRVKDGKVDALIILKGSGESPEVEYYFRRMADFQVLGLVNTIVQPQYLNAVMTKNNVDPAVANALLTPVKVEEIALKKTESLGLVYFFLFLMYMFIIMFGNTVSLSIAGEKTSRVMEIMITKVKPITMMYAKITAAMISGLLQIGMVAFAYGVAKFLGWTSGDLQIFGMPLDLSVLNPKIFLFLSLYFVLGYVVYALLFASITSVISRMEDIGSIIFPVSILLMGAFMLGMKSMLDPNAGIVLVSSYIPFFSPMVVFSRIVLGEAGVLEILMSIVVLLASIGLLSFIANRIYSKGVMRYSGKTSLADIIKIAKNAEM